MRNLTFLCLALFASGALTFPAFAAGDDASTPAVDAQKQDSAAEVSPVKQAGETSANSDKKLKSSSRKTAKSASADGGSGDEKKDKKNGKKADAANNAKAAAAKANSATGSKAGGKVDLATRVASFTACTAVGLPIAVVRRTKIEIVQGSHDLIGDVDTWYKKIAVVMPGFLAVPYGAVSGGASGALYAVKNAWKNSADKPFGKDAMSMGDVGD